MLLAALAAGWLLSGAPRHLAALRASWPIGLGVALAVLLFACDPGRQALDPLRLALAGLTLAAALHVAGAPPVWTQLALVPAWRHWRCWRCRRCQGWRRCRSPSMSAARLPSRHHAWPAAAAGFRRRRMPPRCRRCWRSGCCRRRGAAARGWPGGAVGRLPAGGRDRGRAASGWRGSSSTVSPTRRSGSVSPTSSINSRYGARSSANRVISVIRPAAVIGRPIGVLGLQPHAMVCQESHAPGRRHRPVEPAQQRKAARAQRLVRRAGRTGHARQRRPAASADRCRRPPGPAAPARRGRASGTGRPAPFAGSQGDKRPSESTVNGPSLNGASNGMADAPVPRQSCSAKVKLP